MPVGRRRLLLAGLFALAAGGCGKHGADGSDPAASAADASPDAQRLAAVVDSWYERWLELNPLDASAQGDHQYDARFGDYLSPTWLADSLANEQDSLEELRAVDPAGLSDSDRITFDAFKYGREIAIEGYRYPAELLPVDQLFGRPAQFAVIGAGGDVHPFVTVQDYDNFLARMDGFVAWVEQAINNMRSGAVKGVVQPRVVIERAIPQLSALAVEDPKESVLWRPILNLPPGLSVPDRQRIVTAWERKLGEAVLPAIRRLRDYLENDYLAHTRPSVGLSALPNGAAWYAYCVRLHTTTSLTPQQVHELGLSEVARIRAAMERLKAQVGHTGDLRSLFEKLRGDPRFVASDVEALLAGYRDLKSRVASAMPRQFAIAPKADFEIRPVEAFREQSAASASYRPGSPDGKRPGVFYVNTWDLPSRPTYLMQAIYLHEAVPGHHFQVSLAQEMDELPRFRRHAEFTAYDEGWGLYAESLGRELGLYDDPYSELGALMMEVWRAVRLVVDTGLHSQGWTREQAIDYMRANTSIGRADIVAEVERYIAQPGQALAYKVGEIRIRALRRESERTLGARFDVRDFHTQVLAGGSLPLPVLEEQIRRWLAR
ncbi:MAG TPA: DUF885 domain-containing protein [Steroidobacteraceae bacterium]|nr:DUF885 domain-containing protein [Steroidobacteraceae bacterium]